MEQLLHFFQMPATIVSHRPSFCTAYNSRLMLLSISFCLIYMLSAFYRISLYNPDLGTIRQSSVILTFMRWKWVVNDQRWSNAMHDYIYVKQLMHHFRLLQIVGLTILGNITKRS